MLSDLDLAIYKTVHDFRGGAKALSAHLSVRPGTLQNKADPACETHHLSVSEALAIMLVSGDYRILHALARETQHACIRLSDLSGVTDVDLLSSYATMNKELGDVAAELVEAFADGVIDRAEYRSIREEMFEAINAQLELLKRLEVLAND